MAVVTMRELLDSGAHFGHQTSRWNPKMKRYILTERNGVYIIDLQQSLKLIDEAYEFVKQTVAHGGTILFVGTKKQAQEPVTDQANRVGMPYVNHRWLGGMLTNFSTVSKRVDRMKELEEIDFDDVAGSGHTKKELLLLQRELTKLQSSLGGIRNLSRTPSAVWIIDTEKEHLAVNEAKKLGIPVIGILDTNANPDDVNYPIPGNDDSIRSVAVLTRVIADAVAEGLVTRNQANSDSGDSNEPMAQWERELLATGDVTTETTPQKSPVGDTVVRLVEAVGQSYPGGVLTEIEQEDDGLWEVEVVHEDKLHELQVAPDSTVTVEKVKTKDSDIQRAAHITVPLTQALKQALDLHAHAVLDSIELEDKDGVLYWEIELKDQQGNDIELELPATS